MKRQDTTTDHRPEDTGDLGAQVNAQKTLQQAYDELEARFAELTAELAQANEALRLEIAERKRTGAWFRGLMEAAPDAIVTVGHDGRIVLVNAQAEKLFGYRRKELLGESLEILLPERFRGGHARHRAAYAADPRARPMGNGLQLFGRRKDGSEFPVDVSLSPLPTEEGIFTISAIRDTTERKRAEEERAQLIREQAARAEAEAAIRLRDEFLSSVSHDLKTPLAAIKGHAQLLIRRATRAGVPETERIVEGLVTIDGVASKMSTMIGELLDLARLQVGRPLALDRCPMDLVELLRQVVAEQQRTTDRHRIVVDAAVPRLAGSWDGARLERVVGNLLSNAIKYSPSGGTIVVHVAPEDGAAGRWAILEVRDQGIGVPVADLPHVFEHFHRGQNVLGRIAGTGIGLAGARQIVEQHGGAISVVSEEGKGSTFTVRLPLGDAAS